MKDLVAALLHVARPIPLQRATNGNFRAVLPMKPPCCTPATNALRNEALVAGQSSLVAARCSILLPSRISCPSRSAMMRSILALDCLNAAR